jgi:hypothetical protein
VVGRADGTRIDISSRAKLLLTQQQLLRDVQYIDCVLVLLDGGRPKGVLLAGLIALVDGCEINVQAEVGVALLVDTAGENGALLKGYRAARSGRVGGDEVRSSGAEGDDFLLLFPGIGEIHV